MSRSKNLAVKYLAAAVLFFGVMTLSGLLAATYYINPEFLFGLLHFSIAKILHIDTMIIWLLMGFMGAVYWFLPDEFGREPVGIWAAEILFWVFVVAVLVVAAIFVFVQWGPGTETTLWLFQQGRKYVEAPRWAAIGVALVMLVFAWNVVGTALQARRITGVMAVMSVNMVPLVLLYLIAFPNISNMAVDLYWWWWLVHLWVEATWEILIGCIMALAMMKLLGTSRQIVEGSTSRSRWCSAPEFSASAIITSGSERPITGWESAASFRRSSRCRFSAWSCMRSMMPASIA
jgi:nitric oxide reductase subunit B